MKLLECVAQLLDLKISGAPLSIENFWRLCIAFVGALNSETFIAASSTWRHAQSNTFQLAIGYLREDGFFVPPLFYSSKTFFIDSSLEPFVDFFEDCEKNPEVQWYWRGWWSTNADGRGCYFPLHPIYSRLGKEFTQNLYLALDRYFAKGKTRQIVLIRPFSEFIAHHPSLTREKLLDPHFMTEFWIDFVTYYVSSRHERGNHLATIMDAWNGSGRRLAEECLQPSGLFAPPSGGFPATPRRKVAGNATKIKTTDSGVVVKTRLITDIPIEVTDENAIEHLIGEVTNDVCLIEKWAQQRYEEITCAVNSRKSLAATGTPRIVGGVGTNIGGQKFLTSRHNPDAFKNAAATFEHYGYFTNQDRPIALLFPQPLPEIAVRLGIPAAGAFLPHLALLVIDHPIITPSFLEKCELYDQSGNLWGYIRTDNGNYLRSQKDRAGAWQEVLLSKRCSQVVDDLLTMTKPLRDYLKEHKNDDWRYLLLSSGKSFGVPARVKNISSWTCHPVQQSQRGDEVSRITGIPHAQAQSLMNRFSLATLRASVGVLVYLRTGSAEEMAKALGHAEYVPSLLERYLPEPILRLFQDRWIRLFQTGMVVHAMKDSALLLEASGLKDMDQLSKFISKHAFQPLDEVGTEEQLCQTKKLYVSVDENILAVLLKLQSTVQKKEVPVSSKATFWSAFSEKLVLYIESEASGQEELQTALSRARCLMDGFSFDQAVLEE